MSFKRLNNFVLLGNIMNHVLFNFVRTLFKRSVKIYELRHRKHDSRGVLPIKENVICKEKFNLYRKSWNCY